MSRDKHLQKNNKQTNLPPFTDPEQSINESPITPLVCMPFHNGNQVSSISGRRNIPVGMPDSFMHCLPMILGKDAISFSKTCLTYSTDPSKSFASNICFSVTVDNEASLAIKRNQFVDYGFRKG